jgi:hypothetical protein
VASGRPFGVFRTATVGFVERWSRGNDSARPPQRGALALALVVAAAGPVETAHAACRLL